MTHFKISLTNPDFESDWVYNTADDVTELRNSLAEWTPRAMTVGHVWLRIPNETSQIRGMTKPAQVANFVALVNKAWNHLAFMAGQQAEASQSPPLNPWGMMQNDKLPSDADYTIMSSGCLHITPCDDGGYVIKIKLFAGAVPRTSIVTTAMRLANMAEWCVKYDGKIKLSGSAKLKWKTFSEISVHVQPGVKFPDRRAVSVPQDGDAVRRAQQRRRLEDFYGSPSTAEDGLEPSAEDLDDEQ